MTLVATFSVKNWPVLVGDIMLSRPAREQEFRPFNIPTHSNVNARLSADRKTVVSGLVQKAVVLNPRLALAWSGTEICARSVFHDILQLDGPISLPDVASVLDERRCEAGMDLFVTGIWLEEVQGKARPIIRFAWDSALGWEGRTHVIPEYGNCYAGGSGAEAFLGLLGGSRFSLSAGAPALEEAICLSLSHLGRLAGDQMRTGAGLRHFFGGGFEIVTLLEDQLQKLGDCTYHFWEAKTAPKDQIKITFHASLRVAYFEDYLVIRRLEFGSEVENALGADQVYVIRPVDRLIDDAERERVTASVSRPSMNARFSIFYVHMPEKQASYDTYVAVHKSEISEGPKVSIVEGDGHINLGVHSDVLQRLHRALNS